MHNKLLAPELHAHYYTEYVLQTSMSACDLLYCRDHVFECSETNIPNIQKPFRNGWRVATPFEWIIIHLVSDKGALTFGTTTSNHACFPFPICWRSLPPAPVYYIYPYGLWKWLDRVLNKVLLFFSYWAVVLILNIPKPYKFAGPAECNKKSPSRSDHHVQNPKDQREQRATYI